MSDLTGPADPEAVPYGAVKHTVHPALQEYRIIIIPNFKQKSRKNG
jgi:hypothetical protein